MIVEVGIRLVEEAVLCALASSPQMKAFHREREPLYAIGDAEQRDRGFAELSRRWFQTLRLGAPLEAVLAELPAIGAAVEACFVAPAVRAADEGAELYVAPAPSVSECRRRLRIQLLPRTLVDPSALLPLLRRELLHIADMVDPAFGYEPSLPSSPAGPTHDRMLLERYSALWSATVRGRLTRRGLGLPGDRETCLARWAAAFPMLADRAEEMLARFFDGPRPEHRNLVRFAQDPRAAAGIGTGRDLGGRCSLCGFPSYSFEPDAAVSANLVARIRTDFPNWGVERGLCTQCAELYRSRRSVC